jgi:hypothetical protein
MPLYHFSKFSAALALYARTYCSPSFAVNFQTYFSLDEEVSLASNQGLPLHVHPSKELGRSIFDFAACTKAKRTP